MRAGQYELHSDQQNISNVGVSSLDGHSLHKTETPKTEYPRPFWGEAILALDREPCLWTLLVL